MGGFWLLGDFDGGEGWLGYGVKKNVGDDVMAPVLHLLFVCFFFCEGFLLLFSFKAYKIVLVYSRLSVQRS